jgi:hypothetical protein
MIARFAETVAGFVRSRASVASHPVIPEALGYALAATLSTVQRAWGDSPPGTSFAEMLESALDVVIAPFEAIVDEGRLPRARTRAPASG